MDLDMVREHEEAEFTTDALPQNKPAPVAITTPPVHTPEAPAVKDNSPVTPEVVISGEKPVVAAKQAGNPNRRALPPMGTGRRPGDAPIKKRRLRGVLRTHCRGSRGRHRRRSGWLWRRALFRRYSRGDPAALYRGLRGRVGAVFRFMGPLTLRPPLIAIAGALEV